MARRKRKKQHPSKNLATIRAGVKRARADQARDRKRASTAKRAAVADANTAWLTNLLGSAMGREVFFTADCHGNVYELRNHQIHHVGPRGTRGTRVSAAQLGRKQARCGYTDWDTAQDFRSSTRAWGRTRAAAYLRPKPDGYER